MPRMAATNPCDSLGRPRQRPVPLHGPDKVIAASWLKTALPSDQRAERPLIDAHQEDQHPSRQVHHALPQEVHARQSNSNSNPDTVVYWQSVRLALQSDPHTLLTDS